MNVFYSQKNRNVFRFGKSRPTFLPARVINPNLIYGSFVNGYKHDFSYFRLDGDNLSIETPYDIFNRIEEFSKNRKSVKGVKSIVLTDSGLKMVTYNRRTKKITVY